MPVTIEGVDEISEALDRLSSNLEELDGEIAVTELFTPDFMSEYTDFESFEEFLVESPWEVTSTEDFQQIPQREFDEYVDAHTGFDSWEMMLKVGVREYLAREFRTLEA